jgi:uncharacterized protein with GYD domain
MPTYISLARLTQQGVQNIKEAPRRIEAGRQAFEAAGARLHAVYVVSGQYDYVLLFDAPNEETAAAVMLTLGRLGNVRSETMRAFTEEEFGRVASGLP